MNQYDLHSVSLPKLYKKAIVLFTKILENKTTNSLLMPKLLKDGGISDFFKKTLHEPLMALPLVPSLKPASEYQITLPDTKSNINSSPFDCNSISQLAQAYANKAITPLELTDNIIISAKKHISGKGGYNLFISFDEEDIRKQAIESALRIQQNKARSILEGIPIAIKDEIDQLPYPTTVGTKVFGKTRSQTDSTIAKRLRDQGAILLGKANMHEIGINPNGYNAHYGRAKNPYLPSHDTGGSSSASAAISALGLASGSIGADGGGSIRIPASFCGVLGLKPTFGRVSEYGAFPLCWSVAHIGPLATNTFDLSVLYGIIAGPDKLDSNTCLQPKVTLPKSDFSLKGKTIGIFRPWFEHAQPEIVQMCEKAVQICVKLGAQLKEIEIPELNAMRQAHSIIIVSEMATSVKKHLLGVDNFAHPTRINLEIGNYFSAVDYIHALRMRARANNIFQEIFSEVDVIITPSTAVTAPYIHPKYETNGYSDLSMVIEIMRYAFPANLIGIPAINIPVGYDSNGLPIGMQIMANHWEEDLLLGFSQCLEPNLERKTPAGFHSLVS